MSGTGSMSGAGLALCLYRGLARLGTPLVTRHLARRRAAGREHETRWPERLGRPGLARPAGRLVWLHGASVGESLSLLPLIARLKAMAPATTVLVTTGTVTSARLMESRLTETGGGVGALHQFAPVDLPVAVDGFLDHWRPDAAVFVESEIWPNLIDGLDRRRIPRALVNARMSATSARRWARLPGLAARLIGGFRPLLAQDDDSAARFSAVLGRPVPAPGNLKDAAEPLPADPAAVAALKAAIGPRPVWLAASTHPGEETQILAADRAMRTTRPGLLTVIVPRHPERGPALADEIRAAGLRVARRAAGEPLAGQTQVYLADTLGELGLFFRAIPLTFIGGSLVPVGGHNLLEPARLGAAVTTGPHLDNFESLAARFRAAGAVEIVEDAAALARTAGRLLDDPAACERLARAGARVAEEGRAAVEAIAAALVPLLEPAEASGDPS
ncbi:3-deoxy-D-manno-octulosonic acid transferase [Tistrella mobilis]|uniref:3-deoxy-D-manno-octulosonic acid transferase n=1 Tax=Tistrella mobilis TaxID=171437 RepID=UPI00355828B3